MSAIELTGRNMAGLLDGFQHVAKSPASRDLPLLKAVRIVADETSVTVLATDRFIAARRTVDRETPGEPVAFTMTAETLDDVLRVVKPAKVHGHVFGLVLTDGVVTLTEWGMTRLSAPEAPGDYPVSVGDVIDKAHASEVESVTPTWAFDSGVLTRLAGLGCKGGNVLLRLPEKPRAVAFTIPAWSHYPDTVGAVMPRRSA